MGGFYEALRAHKRGKLFLVKIKAWVLLGPFGTHGPGQHCFQVRQPCDLEALKLRYIASITATKREVEADRRLDCEDFGAPAPSPPGSYSKRLFFIVEAVQ